MWPNEPSHESLEHAKNILFESLRNPMQAVAMQENVPRPILLQAVWATCPGNFSKHVDWLAKLSDIELAIMMTILQSMYHQGYAHGQGDAVQGKNWQQMAQRSMKRGRE